MTSHLVKMSTAAVRSVELASKADSDGSLAEQNIESARVDQEEAQSLQQHAELLEGESVEEEELAQLDGAKEKEYNLKAAEEQGMSNHMMFYLQNISHLIQDTSPTVCTPY